MNFIRQTNLPYPQPWEFVLKIIGEKQNGIFVDVGAYDGVIVSNTHYFEDKLNWKGLCIEPNPNAFEKLLKSRTSNCINIGISNDDTELEFIKVNGYAEMLSGFKNYISDSHYERINEELVKNGGNIDFIIIKVRKLKDIFIENNINNIDYLSIDTEGNEFNVLNSIDYDTCYINIISVENNDNSTDVKNFLTTKGFCFVTKICGDDIYKNTK